MSPRIFFTRDPVTKKEYPVRWLPNGRGSFHAVAAKSMIPLCRATTVLIDDPGDDEARSRDGLACVHCQNLVRCRRERV